MDFYRLMAGLALTGTMVLSASSAWADFRICNKTDSRINASIGYKHDDYGWTAEGWWGIDAGECTRILNGRLSQKYYYVYAMSDNGVWEAEKDEQDGGFFCVGKAKYTFHNSDYQKGKTIDCEASGQVTKHFLEVDTGGADDFTYNLKD